MEGGSEGAREGGREVGRERGGEGRWAGEREQPERSRETSYPLVRPPLENASTVCDLHTTTQTG